eukprot:361580-Chlamydomonas_euryale.AAC.2
MRSHAPAMRWHAGSPTSLHPPCKRLRRSPTLQACKQTRTPACMPFAIRKSGMNFGCQLVLTHSVNLGCQLALIHSVNLGCQLALIHNINLGCQLALVHSPQSACSCAWQLTQAWGLLGRLAANHSLGPGPWDRCREHLQHCYTQRWYMSTCHNVVAIASRLKNGRLSEQPSVDQLFEPKRWYNAAASVDSSADKRKSVPSIATLAQGSH